MIVTNGNEQGGADDADTPGQQTVISQYKDHLSPDAREKAMTQREIEIRKIGLTNFSQCNLVLLIILRDESRHGY